MASVRRLTAILAADVAGYSRLMGADEEGTHERLRAHLRELIEPKIAEHRGRVVKNTGDGFLAEFASVVDAVRCATEVQAGMTDRNATVPQNNRIEFRIGVHQGDVVIEDHDIFGDAVNVAARLEGLAEPGGICLSARVRGDAAGKIDLAFEDMGQQQLKNITRPLRVYRVRADRPGEKMVAAPPALALPDKPSIAVLPFQNMSGDPEQEYFADGMVEEITTALSRIRWLFVIARNSAFTYKGQAVDIKRVGRELGVRYVLEGSVRKGGGRVRITAQLIEAETGAHLWADRFDGSLDAVFDFQDEVATSVAGVIEPALRTAEISRVRDVPTSDLTAYDLYLQSLSRGGSGEKNGYLSALELLERALERDPGYAPALALTAFCHFALFMSGWSNCLEATRRRGIDLAHAALRFTKDEPTTIGRAAYVLGSLGEDIDAAIALMDRSLELNPSSADNYRWSGWLRLYTGQPEVAIRHFEAALRLNPRDRNPAALMGIGVAHFFARRFEQARTMLVRSLQEHQSWVPSYRFLAACYAHLGQIDKAQEIVMQLRDMTNDVVPKATHWRVAEHRELYLAGLRLAAGEAT